jgi:transposase-like protein
MQKSTEPMDASKQFCPNEACSARGKRGASNISIHGRKRPRYKCQICKKTFSARKGTFFEGLRTEEEKVIVVVILLSYGCPLQAIVHAFGLDERTVAAWQQRAGEQCQRVHTALVEAGQVKSQHIQADEIRAKGRKIIVWMALAMDVTTRLWLAGAVSQHRDRRLIDHLLQHARAWRLSHIMLYVVGESKLANHLVNRVFVSYTDTNLPSAVTYAKLRES